MTGHLSRRDRPGARHARPASRICKVASALLVLCVAGCATERSPTEPEASSAWQTQSVSAAAQGIAGGENHSCAIRPNGTVVCWGRNQEGQLGDGTNQRRLTPVPVIGLT